MRIGLAFAAGLLAVGTAAAASAPEDFAYGVTVQTDTRAGLYRLPLPATVYEGTVTPRLGDLRVFNADGQPVPHTVRTPGPVQEETAVRTVPHFPLRGEGGEGRDTNLTVTTDDDGSVVSIQRSGRAGRDGETTAYLVDLSAVDTRVESLRLSVSPREGTGNGRLDARLEVATSEDLTAWRTLMRHAPLVRLDYQGHRLEQTTVALPAGAGPYLRLSWPAAAGGYRLDTVRAVTRPEGGAPPLQWLEPAAQPASTETGEYDFDTAGRFPVQRLEVVPAYDNAFMQVSVYSRADEEAQWQRRYSGQVYRLSLDGTTLRSDPADVPVTRHRHWRVLAESRAAGAPAPGLRLGWQPEQLYFVAQGPGPYTLAFGSAEAEAGPSLAESVLRAADERRIAEATAGPRQTLGGAARLRPGPEPLPWERIALWGILILAVAVLAFLAWRLYRQMDGDAAG